MNQPLLSITLSMMLLSGCANSDLYSGDVYRAGQAKQVQSVTYGTIVTARPVLIQAENKLDLFGGIAGAVAGGVAGSALGGGKGNQLATVAGVIGGAVAGEKIADKMNQIKGVELEIKKEDGCTVVVVQKADPRLVVGQKVRLVNDGKRVNVSIV